MAKKLIKIRFRSYSWMLINTLFWGAAFFAVKPALNIISPTRYLLYRYFFAVIFSLPILFYYRKWLRKPRIKKIFPKIIGIELLGTVLALLMLYAGLARTTSIEANLLTMSMPIMVTFGGVWFLKEREEKHEITGLIFALFGTLILVSVPFLLGNGNLHTISFIGNLLIFFSMIIDSAYYLLAKKYYHRYPMFLITTISFYIGFLSFLILGIIEQINLLQQTDYIFINHNGYSFYHVLAVTESFISTIRWEIIQPSVLFAAVYMALFGSIIGLTAYYKGQDGIEASEASLFTYLQPLVAVPLGFIFLHEHLYIWQILGLILILFGVLIAEHRWKSRK